MKKKIFLSGYWEGNLGDDLFLDIICKRYPNSIFYIITESKHKNKYEHIKNLKVIYNDLGILKKTDNVLKRIKMPYLSSLLPLFFRNHVEIGGSLFIQGDDWKNKLKKRKLFNSFSKNYIVIGSNFGPFFNQEYLKEYSDFFKQCDYVSFRDNKSRELFYNVDIKVYPDIVFSMEPQQKQKDNNTILISIINPELEFRTDEIRGTSEIYYKTLANFAHRVIDKGYTPVFISFCEKEQDSLAIEKMKKYLDNEQVSRISTVIYTDISEILDLYANACGVISSRFHSIVLSWLFGKKNYSLTYSNKSVDLIRERGNYMKYTPIEKINDQTVQEMITTLFTDENNVPIINKLEASKHFEYLDKLLRANHE
ncbi:polysaccharide pyruvyl transferase family protein [Vagococcus lutrae]|uniref:polysaccharide pyruvyl transferase family protein n=1 Tax=Vagococcus lutrae TaxID=81947 RepID=UPI0028900618|nr:polysaccharide pyruvyl transferase family protein [Vagococcus lutrae]MDT2817400.1 polysaccharide pyruvyl transferase family protein [Vagococcus lutrae]